MVGAPRQAGAGRPVGPAGACREAGGGGGGRRPASGRHGHATTAPGFAHNSDRRYAHYLIEFRFHGMAKEMMRDITYNVREYFMGARQRMLERRVVPHITLAGSLTTGDETRLVQEVVAACKNHKIVKFKLAGFDRFYENVIYVKINPSPSLVSLQKDIATRLSDFSKMGEHDLNSPFIFHGTLHMDKNGIRNFNKIWEFINTYSIPTFDLLVSRVTILKNGRILREHDLILDRTFDRREALSRSLAEQTDRRLAKIIEPPTIDYLEIDDREQVYLISDLHFDHTNIIRYSKRPFPATGDMNNAMVKNWTNTVEYNDKVFFLGDMTYGRHRRPIDYWLQKLTGDILFIRGNHDTDIITKAKVIPTNYGIRYKGREFLLAHDPYRPDGFDGWLIHGDKHNTDLNLYPLVNQKRKTANISAELIDYTPISLDRLIELIDTGRKHPTLGRVAVAP